MISMGKTSNQVKNNWKRRNYRQYNVNLRIDVDGDLIDLVEAEKEKGLNTTEVFRKALETLKNESK